MAEWSPPLQLGIKPDWGAFERVFKKVARGLHLYETSTPFWVSDIHIQFDPIDSFPSDSWTELGTDGVPLLPEVGSRDLQRLILEGGGPHTIQPSRFEFLSLLTTEHRKIRMLVRNVLVVTATFDEGPSF